MRPEVLTLRGFGAFPKEEIIDFRKLNGKCLFLIHGPTGAGKTTILDGLCFALYGESSGAERNGRTMRSDHADINTPTEVDYVFRVGPKRYRVQRSPDQERPKRRSAGTTRDPATATLWRESEETGVPAWEVVADGWNPVTEAVCDLLKFNVTQFRQVILLPQGQFEEFLMSGSQAREGILEALFQSELYRQIETVLKARAVDLQGQIAKYREEILTLYQAAGVESDETMKQAVSECASGISKLSTQTEALRAEETKSQGVFSQAQVVNAKFVELNSARQTLSVLTAKLPEVNTIKTRLARHQNARQMSDVVVATQARREEHAKAQKAHEEAVSSRVSAEKTKVQTENALLAEEARAPEREKLASKKQTLNELKPKVEALLRAAQSLERAKRAATEAGTKFKVAREDLGKVDTNLQQLQREREKDLVLSGKKGEANLEAKRLVGVVKKMEKLSELLASAGRGKAVLANNDRAVSDAEKALRDATKLEDALLLRWRKGYAVEIAKSLQDGEPCVVCGAKHHPSPATGRSDHPDDDEIDAARVAVTKARDALSSATNKQVADRSAAEGLAKRIDDLKEDIGPDVKKDVATLQRALAKANSDLQLSVDAANRLKEHAQNLSALERTKKSLGSQIESMELAVKTAGEKASAAKAKLQTIQADVPAAYVAPGKLDSAIEKATRDLTTLNSAFNSAKTNAELASKTAAVTLAQENACNVSAARSSGALSKAEDTLRLRLTAVGFVDEDVWRNALLADDVASSMDADTKAFEQEHVAAKDRFTRAEEATAGLAVPDMTAIEAALLQAQEAARAASSNLAMLEERARSLKSFQGQIDTTVAKSRKSESDYALVGGLADTAGGKNPYRMSLQRYVLASTLDHVLMVASHKFQKMTDGHYTLKRKSGTGDQRTAGGLDLAVLDYYTGKERDVVTLSGGEKFLASLALALSLAEVVQGYAGGVHLESVFVDEGFGSLDEDGTLDRAMQVFSDMQKGGRLVGIISHVGELRERIDARLEVVGGRNGSSTRFIV